MIHHSVHLSCFVLHVAPDGKWAWHPALVCVDSGFHFIASFLRQTWWRQDRTKIHKNDKQQRSTSSPLLRGCWSDLWPNSLFQVLALGCCRKRGAVRKWETPLIDWSGLKLEVSPIEHKQARLVSSWLTSRYKPQRYLVFNANLMGVFLFSISTSVLCLLKDIY